MPSKRTKSIGVFDSGFGGITVLRGIMKHLPEYDYIYLGDTARIPYGPRTKESVYRFTQEAVDFLFSKGAELIIIACNTVSSDALRKIQQEYVPAHYPGKKVLGVLIPAAESASRATKNKRIGVIATIGTVRSRAFVREIKKLDAKITVFQNACPLLVPLVEAGKERSRATMALLKKYLAPLRAKKIDTLILGCTHYEVFKTAIQKIMGPQLTVISEANIVPEKLKNYLERHPEIEIRIKKSGQADFYTTELTEQFIRLGSRFFGKKIIAQKATLK